MSRICLILVVAATLAVQLLQFTQAIRHPQKLCPRFEKNCRQYTEHCSTPEEPTNDTTGSNHVATMWPSCCKLAQLTNDDEATSGVYNVYGPGGHFSSQQAYCDIQPDEGAWTVIQRRMNGTLLFNRTWSEYVDGFGALTGEFWYGLNNMHWLTRGTPWRLQVTMTTDEGDTHIAQYSQFRIDSFGENYRLEIDGYSGTSKNDILTPYNLLQFSAWDNLNNNQGTPCTDKAGWWYRESCVADGTIDLNGAYSQVVNELGIKWDIDIRNPRQIVQTEMKIQPQNCLEEKSN